jgi:HNH endonuclease
MAAWTYDEALRRLHAHGLTAEILRVLLTYDPATGIFRWRVRAGPRAAGSIAGSKSDDGYWVIGLGGKVYKAQRLAYLYMTVEWPPGQIDHRNIDHADNRWDNLRLADTSRNKANNPGYRR